MREAFSDLVSVSHILSTVTTNCLNRKVSPMLCNEPTRIVPFREHRRSITPMHVSIRICRCPCTAENRSCPAGHPHRSINSPPAPRSTATAYRLVSPRPSRIRSRVYKSTAKPICCRSTSKPNRASPILAILIRDGCNQSLTFVRCSPVGMRLFCLASTDIDHG